MSRKEIRNIDTNFLQFEEREDNEPRKLRGHAIVYNSLSEPIYGAFRERVLPGALETTLRENDQLCLWSHNTMYVLGRKSAGTLSLRDERDGLYFEVEPPNTSWARDLTESVSRGDIKQMSFGFCVDEERWLQDKDTIKEYSIPIREIVKLTLYELSPVAFPAYSNTSVREDINEIYIPTPPALEVDNRLELRDKIYKQKIRLLKIKNNRRKQL